MAAAAAVAATDCSIQAGSSRHLGKEVWSVERIRHSDITKRPATAAAVG